MSATSLLARLNNAWRALLNPTATTVEHELTRDRAKRHPDGLKPTPREYEKSRNGSVGLEVRVKRTDRRRAQLSQQLLGAKAATDAAVKNIVDFARSPHVTEVLDRAAVLRKKHPHHAERLSFRGVHLPAWTRVVIEIIVIIADWGVWFTLLMLGMGLSFTKMASPTDPTKVYNADWFLAHPAEWVTAFVVPTFAALFTLAVGKLAARRWAQHAALSSHPERADDISVTLSPREMKWWTAALALLSGGLYCVAGFTFMEFASGLGWLIAAPWAVIPLGVFLVERYGQDPIADLDAMILGPAAEVEARREKLEAALMSAEDAWRRIWTTFDDLLREIIDGASSDLNYFDQLHMRANANSETGLPFAPIGEGAQPAVGRTLPGPGKQGATAHAAPVVLEAQRGLVTKVAPWITKQIEQDIQTLIDCRPHIDSGDARATRIAKTFDTARSTAEAGAGAEGGTDAAATAAGPAASGSVDLDPEERATWDLLAEEAARE